MFTVCSHCKTKFRVSSAQLKAAQGQVQCGKCHKVFDAFWALEGNNSDPQTVEPEPPTMPNLDSVSPTPAPPPELDTIIRAGSRPMEDDAQRKTPAPSMSPLTEYPLADAPSVKVGPRKGTLPPIGDLFGDHALVADGSRQLPRTPLQDVGAVISAEPDAEQKFGQGPGDSAAPEDHTTPEPQGTVEFAIPSSVHAEDLPQPPKARTKRPTHSALWALGITLMLVVLLLQLVNADREALAQNPVLGPSLMALYSAIGRPVPPPRSVNGWDVSGLNVTSDPQAPGVLSITGTLQNQAGFVQPWPYLRVELTDRFGQTLRGRDFRPTEYLAAAESGGLLPVGRAARFRIDIADPGADAVGFTLAPCLDLSSGRLCAASEHD